MLAAARRIVGYELGPVERSGWVAGRLKVGGSTCRLARRCLLNCLKESLEQKACSYFELRDERPHIRIARTGTGTGLRVGRLALKNL